jgi:hypothetical protein
MTNFFCDHGFPALAALTPAPTGHNIIVVDIMLYFFNGIND